MVKILGPETLRETLLWKRLNGSWRKGPEQAVARLLSSNLEVICNEAASRMKAFPSLHPQYTLHDEAHLLRVVELMGRLIPCDVMKKELNPVEIALLILAAYMHDQGMILDAAQLRALENDQDFRVYRANWAADHPNLKEIRQRSLDIHISATERDQCHNMEHELEAAMLTDYIRNKHGRASDEFVRTRYGSDKRLEIAGSSLAPVLGKLCLSHTLDVSDLTPVNGFHYDEDMANFSVNVVYLAIVLRLADILDFDRERTPDALFRTVHFTSPVSLREWSQHRAVNGWTIKPGLIRFSIQCDRPEYHRSVLQFMDWIDHELQGTSSVLRAFPADFVRYRLSLPEKVNRERIQPKDNAYIYHDLEFSLSRDEVVKLLMGKELYGSPSLCIRELIQNSLDALRYRKALVKRDDQLEWLDGCVELIHTVDPSGREILRCKDNGVGMDEDIIKRFLVRAGRSYYRSPEFERERTSLAAAEADFDPCSRFGIGFMSCFMLGDQIRIQTRRCGGSKRTAGKPLIVEINGLNGLVIFRAGPDSQEVGTSVEITGRLKPAFFDEWTDRIKLVEAVEALVLAPEFPVYAKCQIPEIASSVEIPPGALEPTHSFQAIRLKKFVRFDQSFCDIDRRLRGSMRTCLLTDGDGQLVLANDEAAWASESDRNGPSLKNVNGEKIPLAKYSGTKTCLDGILVCGAQGRKMDERMHVGTTYPNWINAGADFFVLDVRGDIKPALTPARAPAGDRGPFMKTPTWDRLQQIVDKAHGRLWEQVLQRYSKVESANNLWQLAAIYSADFSKVNAGALWDLLWIPVFDQNDKLVWRHFCDITRVPAGTTLDETFARDAQGSQIRGSHEFHKWLDNNNQGLFAHFLRRTVTGMATVEVVSDQLVFGFRPPSDRDTIPHERFHSEMFTTPRVMLPFDSKLAKLLFAEGPMALFNEKHPLTVLAWNDRFQDELPDLSRFISNLITALCSKEVLNVIVGRTDSGPSDPRTLRWLGHMFVSLDWSQITSECHPPYSLWTKDRGVFELSADDFKRWAT